MCIFNCGFCKLGARHFCRRCGLFDSHRSIDCPSINSKVESLQKSTMMSIHAQPFVPAKKQNIKQIVPAIIQLKKTFIAAPITTVTVTILIGDSVLVCRRGVGEGVSNSNFGLIYSCGGKVDATDVSPEAAAIRETREECGVIINTSDLILLSNKFNKNHYYVKFTHMPIIYGPEQGYENESLNVTSIIGISTIRYNGKNTRWSLINKDTLWNHLNENKVESESRFYGIYNMLMTRRII